MTMNAEEYPKYLADMRRLLYSTVYAFTKAIDERTPYNAKHTMHVAEYTRDFLRFLRRRYERSGRGYPLSEQDAEQIVMAAHLHDVGKLVIPLEVMNKANRMGNKGMERIHDRFLLLRAYLEIDSLTGRLAYDEWKRQAKELTELEERLWKANQKAELTPEEIRYFMEIGRRVYRGRDGTEILWLTEEERSNLCIEKGTLNEKERRIMEYHAVATEKILREIDFGERYDKVVEIVSAHHEFLDGSGYPRGLRGEEVPLGSRILTIADIYDSLVATDRPYKRPMSREKAETILCEMSAEGRLDKGLTALFCEYLDTEAPLEHTADED